MFTPAQALIASLLVCFAGALVTWLTAKQRRLTGWLAFGATALSSALALYAARAALLGGPTGPAALLSVAPLAFALRVRVDGLSAVFIALIASMALPAAFYSIQYLDHYREYGVRRYYPNLLLFVAAMYGLVSTTDMMWFFLVFWQMMTFAGYALIRFENKKPENVRAAKKFLVMMQIACALTMIGAELLAATGAAAGTGTGALRYDFDSISHNLLNLLPQKSGVVVAAFALFLAGFGIELGMWPFGQIWLPDAEPAAPSPVSAMLSGVMIKTGVYGLMRYFLWLVPVEAQKHYPAAQWGMVIAVLGTITLFTGTMQALKQEQAKRLLAFHSIGQAGYILLGLGACLILLPCPGWALAGLATVSFFGALLHTINHATFKSLLFLNSGSMLWATGTQDLNKLGGLMRFMPLTALTALVASFSISGMPLCNGFVSKWSIYVGTIQGGAALGALHGGAASCLLPVCAVVAILTSALTIGSFIKFFGASFLSRTSALVAEKAAGRRSLEVGWLMQVPQLLLAAICLLVGLAPALAFQWLQRALESSQQGYGIALANATPLSSLPLAGLDALAGRAVLTPLALAAVLGLGFVAAWALAKLGGARRRAVEPWLCGYARESEQYRYTAHNFYGELKRYFRWVGGGTGARRNTTTSGPGHGPADHCDE
jgi:formate hydrogenlyase subunit 3/multisubunit Na+/H+ antiporter MnhD subunit